MLEMVQELVRAGAWLSYDDSDKSSYLEEIGRMDTLGGMRVTKGREVSRPSSFIRTTNQAYIQLLAISYPIPMHKSVQRFRARKGEVLRLVKSNAYLGDSEGYGSLFAPKRAGW